MRPLEGVRALLLDFDGPVTHLFIDGRAAEVSNRIRDDVDIDWPGDLRVTTDPLDLLRWAGQQGDADVMRAVDSSAIRGELWAASQSSMTPGADRLIQAGLPIVIVSNNDQAAIEYFLARHGLSVQAVVGRPSGRPDLMKPDPFLVTQALRCVGIGADHVALFGDSTSDIEAARRAGVRALGHGKNPTRAAELAAAGADAVIGSPDDLADSLLMNPGD